MKINHDKCVNCGMCAAISPAIEHNPEIGNFDINPDLVEENMDTLRQAQAMCPTEAIEDEVELTQTA